MTMNWTLEYDEGSVDEKSEIGEYDLEYCCFGRLSGKAHPAMAARDSSPQPETSSELGPPGTVF